MREDRIKQGIEFLKNIDNQKISL